MELNWGNILHFNSEKDYYEVLGFLSKEEELIRVYTENNEIKTKSVDSDVVNNVVAALLTKFRKEK